MLDFNDYLMRHGEFWVQALIEKLERYDGIRPSIGTPLEDRWNALMQSTPFRMAA